LTEGGSLLQCRIAGLAAFYALLNNPALIKNRAVIKVILRSVINSSNYDKLTTALKTIF